MDEFANLESLLEFLDIELAGFLDALPATEWLCLVRFEVEEASP